MREHPPGLGLIGQTDMTQPTCSVPTVPPCTGTVQARGWCAKHYARYVRHGDPLYGEGELPRSTPGVYTITCLANGWVYVGSTQSIRMRWKTHKSHLRNARHGIPQLQADWDKYGPDAFLCELVTIVTDREERLDCEQEHIDAHWGNGRFYNLSPSARDNTGHKFTPEQGAKVSAAHKGKPKSAEHRANLWMNREVTQEQVDRMREVGRAGRGKSKSEDHRRKIGEPQRGSGNHMAKLTEDIVREIRQRLAGGEKGRVLAREFGVSEAILSNIKHRKIWVHVTDEAEPEPGTLF